MVQFSHSYRITEEWCGTSVLQTTVFQLLFVNFRKTENGMHAFVKWKMVSYSISWYHFQVTVSDRAHLGPDGVIPYELYVCLQ